MTVTEALKVSSPKFYVLLNNRWRVITEYQLRALTVSVLKKEVGPLKIKDINGKIVTLKETGTFDRDIVGLDTMSNLRMDALKLKRVHLT